MSLLVPLGGHQVHKMVKFASGRGGRPAHHSIPITCAIWLRWLGSKGVLLRPFRADSFGHPSFPGRCPGLLHYAPLGLNSATPYEAQSSQAPKERNGIAQGNALGKEPPRSTQAPSGR